MTLNTTTSTPNSTINLSEEQQKAIDLILAWFKQSTKLEFNLGGYAGTGKTTLIKYLLSVESVQLNSIKAVVSAFTGKACHVLRKKGVHSAQTIHSLIYDCETLKNGTVIFNLRTTLESRPNLIIIDEASMISTDLYHDLQSFGIKLLFIGDPGQLEPVGDNPNLMLHTDYTLQKIHRQAESSSIITLATSVRHGGIVRSVGTPGVPNGVLVKGKFITDEELANVDQIICAKNATRNLLNRRVRNFLKQEAVIEPEEKLICLRNNRKFGLFNGLICTVIDIVETYDTHWELYLKDEAGKEYHNIPVWRKPFTTPLESGEQPPSHLCYFDYGYAITCHKSQGSEWPHVLVYDEVMFKTDMKRWRYTAITRASEKLTYCV